ncbi:hypothetical protein BC826DRAFT_1063392, partial [Russula brevipes]
MYASCFLSSLSSTTRCLPATPPQTFPDKATPYTNDLTPTHHPSVDPSTSEDGQRPRPPRLGQRMCSGRWPLGAVQGQAQGLEPCMRT